MSEETSQERQINEIEALKAIFGDELVDNREAIAWKVWRPLDLMLTLHPLHSSSIAGVHCSVTLQIKCCEDYPNKPPTLSIHKLHGLSNENGSKLLNELQDLAKKLCGEVMIFELAQYVQNFLHAFNKPTLSFYDEMLERRNEIERLKLQDLQLKENEERQKMKTEIQRRQEILKNATGRQRSHLSSTSQDSTEGQGDAPELVFYADNKLTHTKKLKRDRNNEVACNCVNKGIQILRITQRNNKKIHLGKCLGLQHSTGYAWHNDAWRKSGPYSPGSHFKTFIRRREQSRLRQKTYIRRRLFAKHPKEQQPDKHYGPAAIDPVEDIDPIELKKMCSDKLPEFQKSSDEIKEIELATVGQHDNDLYNLHRSDRLTASQFGMVCKRRDSTPCHNHVKQILYKSNFSTKDTAYGHQNESVARTIFMETRNKVVRPAGLFIDEEYGFLGASPDGHSTNGSTTFLSIDAETGDFVVTKKWTLKPATDFQTRNRQLTQIENDLRTMSRLKHPTLTPYVAMETQQEVNKRETFQSVFLFRDFILGSSLKCLKSKVNFGDSFEALRLLRHVGVGVLSALKELHSEGVVHRDVRCENVYLDDTGAVKLVGVSLDVRLSEIVEEENYCDRQTKAQDIFALAQLLLSIVTDGNKQDIPSHLPSSAKDFFSRCLTEDEQLQWSAEQLMKHGFLLDAPLHIVGSKQHDDGYSGSEDEDKVFAKSIVTNSLPATGHSRLSAEFEVLKWLGKGAFGDVLKVKNKLDGGFYAIKRIKLNPENVQLNKKITREVKLLSRLNHENVVRYYNAWIETIQAALDDDSEISSGVSVVSKVNNVVASKPTAPPKKATLNSMEDAVAKLAPGVKLEWSISEAAVSKRPQSSDSESSSDEEDEDDGWFKMLPATALLDENSSSVEFEVDEDNKSETLPSEDIIEESHPRPPTEHIHQVLYIQMEFCEKNTLRHAIDSGLYLEHFRAWRLFREVVEGLAHVHQRGMIHRDLKPVNIFLDSNDHVKIGDFGLATKAFTTLSGVDDKNKPQEEFGGSLTGQIGTALYVAPELLQSANKTIYNQKVDIYSLGIILFEMFHPLLDTGMERMKVLTELRLKDIVMPNKFVVEDNAKQILVIRWLLNHDASLRPTCAELLSSEHVPRPVPEGALSGLLSHTLSDRRSRGYKRLVAAALDQRLTPAEDYTYHSGLKTRSDVVVGAIKDAVIKIFKSHGADEFSPPLLLPRTKVWDQYPNAVKVMTAFGSVCHLPHDLRLPFARHTAYTETKYMRRYIVDRVFREKHVEGFHPRELVECAFDIVTPKSNFLWPDSELLVVASRAACEVNLKISITLNHTEMLKILLLCCGIPVDRHTDIYPVLCDVRLGRITNLQLQTHLTSLCITKRDISNLLRLMEAELCISEVRDAVAPLTKKAEWSRALIRAITDIELVIKQAKALGVECPMSVAPCLAYDAGAYSGVFWQISVCRGEHGRTARHRSQDLIAVGGRYNALVEEFWQTAKTEKDHDEGLRSNSVGFSMSLERMAAIIKKTNIDLTTTLKTIESTKICVCLWGTISEGRDGHLAARRAQIARDLWSCGFTVCTNECTTASDAHEQCNAQLVLVDEDAAVRVSCWDDNRVREHKVPFIDIVDFVKQRLNPESTKSPDAPSSRLSSWSESDKSNFPTVSVTFITASDKMTKNSRRQCENQITSQVSSRLSAISSSSIRPRVHVVALSCDAACVRALHAHLDAPLNQQSLRNAASRVIDAFPRRRKIIEEAIEELQTMVSQNQSRTTSEENIVYALYSIPDSVCRIVT